MITVMVHVPGQQILSERLKSGCRYGGESSKLLGLGTSEKVSGFFFLLVNSMLIDTVKENIINRHAMNHTTFLSI